MKFIMWIVALLMLSLANAWSYTSTQTLDDGDNLIIHAGTRRIPAPRAEEKQVGFSDAKVSSNGRLVGWLALQPTCCTSYPIPLSLIIFENGKVIQRFYEGQAIWAWSFEKHNSAVAYRHSVTHGPIMEEYKLRSIGDGKLLDEFDCSDFETEESSKKNPRLVPVWIRSIRGTCP